MSEADRLLAKRMGYIGELKTAIRNMHGCESEYVETVPVTETFKGETVWNGDVEVFTIRGHPKAKRAYAWSHATGKNDQARRYVAVLELPPVESPETAVKVAVAAEIKNEREKTKGR
ncbi:MAG TPA: hypothetical protein VEW46_18600 [Pyrinomonadaceae bacterium]|nr:hypothetical protein [Pyrinomonadaceae bacterium]